MDVKKNSCSALPWRLDTSQHWQWNAVKASTLDLSLYQFLQRCLLCLMASVKSLLNQGTLGQLKHFQLLDRCVVVQYCLKCCAIVVYHVIERWSGRFVEKKFPQILHIGIGVDVFVLSVCLHF